MLSLRARRLGHAVALAVALGLSSSPAFAAAGVASLGISGLTTGLGLLAAFWAVLGARGLLPGGSAAATMLLTAAMLGSAFWLWRRQQLRSVAGRVRPLLPRAGLTIPPGLDGDAVLDAARGRFMSLQAAWDAADVPVLRSLTTPDMLEELLQVLSARESGCSRTDVISLHAELLALEELGAAYLASIEFSGLIRESAETGPVPFRELWMLACSKGDGSATWRLARQQALL